MLRHLPDSRRWLLAPVLACFAGLAACAADHVAAPGDSTNIITVASVRLSPASVIVPTGSTIRISATPFDAAGRAIAGRAVSWRSANISVARVDDGVITAVGSGTTDITASVDDVSATGTVQVEPAAVASVQVSLNSGSIAVLQQTQATAVLRDASGNVLTGRTIGWTSNNTSVATVDANGVVRGVGVGSTTIVASSEGRSASATISVTAQQVASITLSPSVLSTTVGQSATIAATVRDAGGNVISGRQPTWTSASTAIATVSSSGAVTGAAAGNTTITASLDGVSANASVTVAAAGQPLPVMAPTTLTLTVGAAGNLTVQMRDPSGNPVPATFTWSTSNAGVATVDANGRVTGVSAGTATVSATADGKSASALVTIIPVPVASVTLSPTSLALVVGQSGALTATCRDAAGAPLTGRTVTWSSSVTGVATVDAVGSVRGVSVGTATVTATCEGRTTSAAVTVSQVPVASVTLSPATATVNTGATVQLTATMRDAGGNVLSGRGVTWSTSSAANATVSSNGLVTGVAVGTATITATSEGRSATATVTVQRPAVASVSVSPTVLALAPGSTGQLTATARDAGGAVIGGTSFTWTTSNSIVASVSNSGLVSAGSVGSATITVTADGRSATAAITVASSSSTAEPSPTANLIFSDNFDAATSAGQGYAVRGTMSLITGRGNTGKAIRFQYTPGSNDNLIERNIQTSTNFYFSYWFRATAGTDFTCGGRNSSGIKWLMFWRTSGPRYTNGVGDLDNGGPGAPQTFLEFTTHDNGSVNQPAPFLQNIAKTPKFGTTNDGNWHRYTIHTVTGNGGYEQIWIDGVLVLDNQRYAYDHDPGGIGMFQMPGLMVAGVSTGCDFNLDIDDIRAWTP